MSFKLVEVIISADEYDEAYLPSFSSKIIGEDEEEDEELFFMSGYVLDSNLIDECRLFEAFDSISQDTYDLYANVFTKDVISIVLDDEDAYEDSIWFYVLPRILFVNRAKRLTVSSDDKLFMKSLIETMKITNTKLAFFIACDIKHNINVTHNTEKLCEYYRSLDGVTEVDEKNHLFMFNFDLHKPNKKSIFN